MARGHISRSFIVYHLVLERVNYGEVLVFAKSISESIPLVDP